MKAVFSLWKRPVDYGLLRYGYNSIFDMACSYVLAIEKARKFYPEINLVTDDSGKNLLVNQLKIPFGQVTTELNELSALSPMHWALPKILAVKVQEKPFIYLEGNIILWNDLPEELKKMELVFQNPEPSDLFDQYYLDILKNNYSNAPVKPKVFDGFEVSTAFNTSLSLINNLELAGYWAEAAIDYVNNEQNAAFWQGELSAGRHHNMIFDYWFPACIASRAGLIASNNVGFYLKEYDAGEYKYTHTHGESRREKNVTEGIWKHIEADYPQYVDALTTLRERTSIS
ncbi:MAG: DUF6734 family protein [Bacteroidia bacterium]